MHYENRKLNGEDITELNQSGANLRADGYYKLAFLFNDKPNNAADQEGGKFHISTEALDKIAKTAVGRPWLIPPDTSKHVRAASGSAEDTIRMQKEFAKGLIVHTLRNSKTNNVYGVVEVFPEFAAEMETGKLKYSPYDSIMIEPYGFNQHGAIADGRIIHVQTVDHPGYPPEIAKVQGACVGMLNKCTDELRTLAASGKLSEFQNQQANILRNTKILRVNLTENEAQVIQMSKGDLEKLLDSAATKAVASYANTLKAASGAAAGTENKTDGQTAESKPASANAAQDTKDPRVTALETQIKTMQDQLAAKDEALAKSARKQAAERITIAEIALNRVKPEDKEKRIGELVEMKLPASPTADLELIEQYLPKQEQIPQIFGASGMPHFPAPTGGKHASFEELYEE